MLNEHLENLIKVEILDKTMLNTKRTELTLKISMNMAPLFGNSSLKPTLTNSSLKTQRKDFGSLGADQGKEIGVRNESWNGLFIGKVRHQLLNRVADI
jgi:hypothetical protein